MKRYVKRRHRFYFALARPIARILARKFNFKTKVVKVKMGEQFLILANHQSSLDPAFLALSFKTPVYIVASDSIYSKKFSSRLLFHCFAPIKKRKGFADINCIMTMKRVAKEGGSLALFPEGNRQWGDFCFPIDISICKLIRALRLPVVLYTFHGGYGVSPRWGKSLRKGKFVGGVSRILSLEEINNMMDEQLLSAVVSTLKVIDPPKGELYKSNEKAEYLERELFVCPKCHSFSTLHSQGNAISCSQCGLTVNYGENLQLSSVEPSFLFTRVVEWYKFQQQQVKNYTIIPNEVLLSDDYAEIYDKSTQDRKLIAKGKLSLTDGALTVGDFAIATSEIYSATSQDGTKIDINTKELSYIVVGGERFNGIKYLLFFNLVCEKIAKNGGIADYGLSIDDSCC